jgi:hypothetical protein
VSKNASDHCRKFYKRGRARTLNVPNHQENRPINQQYICCSSICWRGSTTISTYVNHDTPVTTPVPRTRCLVYDTTPLVVPSPAKNPEANFAHAVAISNFIASQCNLRRYNTEREVVFTISRVAGGMKYQRTTLHYCLYCRWIRTIAQRSILFRLIFYIFLSFQTSRCPLRR